MKKTSNPLTPAITALLAMGAGYFTDGNKYYVNRYEGLKPSPEEQKRRVSAAQEKRDRRAAKRLADRGINP